MPQAESSWLGSSPRRSRPSRGDSRAPPAGDVSGQQVAEIRRRLLITRRDCVRVDVQRCRRVAVAQAAADGGDREATIAEDRRNEVAQIVQPNVAQIQCWEPGRTDWCTRPVATVAPRRRRTHGRRLRARTRAREPAPACEGGVLEAPPVSLRPAPPVEPGASWFPSRRAPHWPSRSTAGSPGRRVRGLRPTSAAHPSPRRQPVAASTQR